MLCSFYQANGQDAGNLGVLHVEGTKDWQDFCIAYNTMWASIPTDLDKTVKNSMFTILFNKTHFVLRSNMANTHGFFDE